MKIDKAIKLLQELARGICLPGGQDYQDAVKLGIEALKRCKEHRASHLCDHSGQLLLGETEK